MYCLGIPAVTAILNTPPSIYVFLHLVKKILKPLFIRIQIRISRGENKENVHDKSYV